MTQEQIELIMVSIKAVCWIVGGFGASIVFGVKLWDKYIAQEGKTGRDKNDVPRRAVCTMSSDPEIKANLTALANAMLKQTELMVEMRIDHKSFDRNQEDMFVHVRKLAQ